MGQGRARTTGAKAFLIHPSHQGVCWRHDTEDGSSLFGVGGIARAVRRGQPLPSIYWQCEVAMAQRLIKVEAAGAHSRRCGFARDSPSPTIGRRGRGNGLDPAFKGTGVTSHTAFGDIGYPLEIARSPEDSRVTPGDLHVSRRPAG